MNRKKDRSIRVSLVDDDNLVRDYMKSLIGHAPGFSCTQTYAGAAEAIAGVPRDRPDVLLVDINMPGLSGIECVRRIKELLPSVQIIMLTMYEDEDMVFESLRAGASGYLLKRTPQEQILEAIAEVHRGGSPMSGAIARKVVQLVARTHAARTGGSAPPALDSLSARENEVLSHLARGSRYKEIAQALGISLETVRTHLRRIYEKLHVTSRTEATVKFLEK